MPFLVKYRIYSPSVRKYSTPLRVVEYYFPRVNKLRYLTEVHEIFVYYIYVTYTPFLIFLERNISF